MSAKARVVHGDDLIYRFLNGLFKNDDGAYGALPQLLLEAMAVWFPPETYQRIPILMPWVVRDPSCRGSRSKGIPDEWGSPNDYGLLRDDNSLIKGLPRALKITGPKGSGLLSARLGTEFVASHVWREVKGSEVLASRLPELNSFVPNLVWLPSQIAKLTDREGSAVQGTLQAMSLAIYRSLPVASEYQAVVERAWSFLPAPDRPIRSLELGELNWFLPTDRFYSTGLNRLRTVVDALRELEAGRPLRQKVITSRYGAGLGSVGERERSTLLGSLEALMPVAGDQAS